MPMAGAADAKCLDGFPNRLHVVALYLDKLHGQSGLIDQPQVAIYAALPRQCFYAFHKRWSRSLAFRPRKMADRTCNTLD